MGFFKRIDTLLNWTELKWNDGTAAVTSIKLCKGFDEKAAWSVQIVFFSTEFLPMYHPKIWNKNLCGHEGKCQPLPKNVSFSFTSFFCSHHHHHHHHLLFFLCLLIPIVLKWPCAADRALKFSYLIIMLLLLLPLPPFQPSSSSLTYL